MVRKAERQESEIFRGGRIPSRHLQAPLDAQLEYPPRAEARGVVEQELPLFRSAAQQLHEERWSGGPLLVQSRLAALQNLLPPIEGSFIARSSFSRCLSSARGDEEQPAAAARAAGHVLQQSPMLASERQVKLLHDQVIRMDPQKPLLSDG